jgi:hypothetical protein
MGITLDEAQRRTLDRAVSPDGELYLGPARVSAMAADGTVRVALPADPGIERTATMAMALPYRPAPGDLLLVIGRAEGWYAIGVLSGHGTTSLTAHGDLEIAAPNGRLDLSAGHAVRLAAPRIDAVARRFQLAADRVIERCQQATRWVAGLLDVRARQSTMVVDEAHMVKAQSVLVRADSQVNLDGEQVHLG